MLLADPTHRGEVDGYPVCQPSPRAHQDPGTVGANPGAELFLQYQGRKLLARFDRLAPTWGSTAVLSSHYGGPVGRGGVEAAWPPGPDGRRRHHLGPLVSAVVAGGAGRAVAGLYRAQGGHLICMVTTASCSRPKWLASLIRRTLELANGDGLAEAFTVVGAEARSLRAGADPRPIRRSDRGPAAAAGCRDGALTSRGGTWSYDPARRPGGPRRRRRRSDPGNA